MAVSLKKFSVALGLSALFFCARAAESVNPWAEVSTPTEALAGQSIGGYAAGCIGGAVALPLTGTGYQVMRLSRNRYYGHDTLIRFIERLGKAVVDENLGTLLVGDLGQPRGGPTPSGHRSHQTGLDVDIWFMLLDKSNSRVLTKAERESWGAPSMLDVEVGRLDYRQWTEAQEKVIRLAALQPEVDRIFVNPNIKRELCEHRSEGSERWLRKIRPWWRHDDHFHVRLTCPDNNPYCERQDPVPEGDGCGASLAWWFSKEAKIPVKAAPAPPPSLPVICEQIINGTAVSPE